MSADVEGKKRLDVRPRAMTQPRPAPQVAAPPPPQPAVKPQADVEAGGKPHDHPLLIDAHEDRWRWRRKIRQNPRKLFFYRICVALLGLLLLCLAALTSTLR